MSLLQPIKKSGVYSIFGKHYGDYLINFITGCYTEIGTICTSIKHCIGIFPEGNPNLVLNQQGDWVSAGSGSQVITKSDFINLISTSSVETKTYFISDIEEGVTIEGISPNTFNPNATLEAYVPVYTEDTDYKGQYHKYIGDILDGEIYTWGEFNYKNETGSPLTPSASTPNELDDTFSLTVLPKNESNYYELISFNVVVDAELEITYILHPKTLNCFEYHTVEAINTEKARACFAWLNYPNNNSSFNVNLGSNTNVLIYNCRVAQDSQLGIFNNTGKFTSEIFNCYLAGAQSTIQANTFQSEGFFENLIGEVAIRKNTIGGSNSNINNITAIGGGYIDILHCQLDDNNAIQDIQVDNDAEVYFWDNHIHENARIKDWIIDNTYVKFANSHLNNNVYIQDVLYNNIGVSNDINITFGHNITLANITNISLNSVSFVFPQDQSKYFDFTSFTENIVGESIESGKGWFAVSHNFDTSPLASGTKISFNLIPYTGRITNIKAIGLLSGTGAATLDIGLENDDESLISDVIAGYSVGKTFSGFSKQAPTNRGLSLKASSGDIIDGIITVLVEFVI